MEFRIKAGERPELSGYLERFPEIARDAELAGDLAEAEAEMRRRGIPAPTDESIPSRATAPAVIGRYELGEIIGRGAFGVVHRAYDTMLRRDRGAEAAPAGRRRDARGRRAVPPRGPRRRGLAPSPHRRRPRRRAGRRRALPGQRPDRGPQPRRRAGRAPARFSPVGRVGRRAGRGAGARPLAGPDPSRRQAVERPDRRRGPRLPDRLRAGQERRRRGDADGRRPGDRHAGLHGARADGRGDDAGRRPDRRLRPGRDPLRAADRVAAVRRGRRDAAGADPRGGAAIAATAGQLRSPATWRRSA